MTTGDLQAAGQVVHPSPRIRWHVQHIFAGIEVKGHHLKQPLRSCRRRHSRVAATFDLDEGSDQVGINLVEDSPRLDERCPIYPELKQMIVKTVGVADVLREALAPMAARLELAYIYGSFANGNARPDSDVDLMVVGDVSSREVYSAADDCTAALRREVHATVYPSEEYAAKLKLGRGFIHETHCGPKIPLIGGGDESG